MDLQSNSVDTRRHTGEKRDLVGEMNEFGSTMAEPSVLFLVASGSSSEMNETSANFTCSGDSDLSRQPVTLLQSSGVSRIADQKRSGTWLEQAGWRVTVEDKSSVNELAGFSVSQTASMPEGGTTSSTDVAKQFPDAAEVGKMPKESVSVEQGQLLRAAEPNHCVLGVKAKPILEMLTQQQLRGSRAHTITVGFLVFSMCVWKGCR